MKWFCTKILLINTDLPIGSVVISVKSSLQDLLYIVLIAKKATTDQPSSPSNLLL